MKSNGGSQGREWCKDVQGHTAGCWFTGSMCYLLLLTSPSTIIHTMKVSLRPLKYCWTIKSHDGAKAGSVKLREARTCVRKSYI